MSNEEADVGLSDDDIDKLKKWYKDIAGIKRESDEKFNERFLKFLGDDLCYGSNRRIMGRFFNLKDSTDQAKLEYFLKVYMHQAAGDRADSENWYWRLAFLVGLLGLALVLGVDFLQRVHAEEWDSLSWLKMILFFVVVIAAGAFFNSGNKIVALLKRLK